MDAAYPLKTWQKVLSVIVAALMAATVWTAAPAPAYAVTGETGSNLTYDTAVGVFGGEYALMATSTTTTTSDGAPSIQTNQAIVRANGTKTINSQKHLGAGTGTDSAVQIAGILGTTKPVVSTTNANGLFGVAALGGSTLVPVQNVAVAYDEAAGRIYAVRPSGSNVLLDVYATSGARLQEVTVGTGTPTDVAALPGFVQVYLTVPNPNSTFGGTVSATKVFAFDASGNLKKQPEADIVTASANDDSGTAYLKTDGTVWYQPAGGTARQIASGANTSARIGFLQANYAKVMYPTGNRTAYTTTAGASFGSSPRAGEGIISAMADRILSPQGTQAQLGDASLKLIATLNGSEFLWEGEVIVGYTPQGTQGGCQFWVYSADDGTLLQGPVSSSTQVALERQGDNYAITYTPASGTQQFAGFYYDANLNLISSNSAPSRLGGILPSGQTIQVVEGTNGTLSAYEVTDVNGLPITCGNYTLALGYVEGAETMGLGDATPRVQHGDDNLYCAQDANGNYGAVNAAGDVYVPFVYDNYYDMGYQGAAAPLNTAKYVMVHRDGQWFFFDVADAKEIPAPSHDTPVTVTPHNPAVATTPSTPAASGSGSSAVSGSGSSAASPSQSSVIPMSPAVKTSLARARISLGNRVYTGKRLYPKRITVKVDGRMLVRDWDYVVSTKGGTKVGRHKVIIYGIGRYSRSAVAYFNIVPKGTKIKHVYRRHRAFIVKWSKQTKQTDGYQIRYSTDKHFKKGVHYKYIKSKKRTAYKVRHLKAHKKYYVQVRTWKKVSGHKYYSSWSKTRSVRTR